MPITSARLVEGITSTTASANRDAAVGSFENAAFYQRRRGDLTGGHSATAFRPASVMRSQVTFTFTLRPATFVS
jgi:hypothetical protein